MKRGCVCAKVELEETHDGPLCLRKGPNSELYGGGSELHAFLSTLYAADSNEREA